MKRDTLFILLIFLLSKATSAQIYIDTIFTMKLDTIVCRITLINDNNIFYTIPLKGSNNKSTYISKADVVMYSLNNKDAEIIKPIPKSETIITLDSPGDSIYLKGQRDALKYYDDTRPGTGTLVISLLSPLAGLIPAIACSSTQPKDKNLNYHRTDLIKNPDYYNCYINAARKIKQKKVWTNWGVAFGVNLVAVIIIFSTSGK